MSFLMPIFSGCTILNCSRYMTVEYWRWDLGWGSIFGLPCRIYLSFKGMEFECANLTLIQQWEVQQMFRSYTKTTFGRRSNWWSLIVEKQEVIFFFFFWPHHLLLGSLFPDQELNLGPWQWKHRVLTTEPPGNALMITDTVWNWWGMVIIKNRLTFSPVLLLFPIIWSNGRWILKQWATRQPHSRST